MLYVILILLSIGTLSYGFNFNSTYKNMCGEINVVNMRIDDKIFNIMNMVNNSPPTLNFNYSQIVDAVNQIQSKLSYERKNISRICDKTQIVLLFFFNCSGADTYRRQYWICRL